MRSLKWMAGYLGTSVVALLLPLRAAGMTVVYPPPGQHIHSSRCPEHDGWSHLVPDPIENGGFFLLDGVSQAAQDELNGGDTNFLQWQIDNKTGFDFDSAFATGKGTLYIDTYKSVFLGPHHSGVDFHAHYVGGAGEDNLRWIQYVKPEQPFDPDQKYDLATGLPIPGKNGPIPPANGGFIDPWPNDGSDGGPFYWHSGEIGKYRTTNAAGNQVLEFRDHPGTFHPPTSADGMQFELYLVNWVSAGIPEQPGLKTLQFLGGIQWGFHGECVPLPASAWMGLGLMVFMALLRTWRRRIA